MYHLELRQFPHVSRVFNLTRDDLERQFVRPWVAGVIIEHDDRRWAPERSRLKILEGPELRQDELAFLGGPEATDEVIGSSDYLLISMPATADTVGLIDRRRLGLMKPHSSSMWRGHRSSTKARSTKLSPSSR